MSIFGPQFNPQQRFQRVDEDSRDERRRQFSKHLGRKWNQKKEAEIEPVFPPAEEHSEENGQRLFGGSVQLQEAEELFKKLTTLEEKVAQLCFFETEAVYNTSIQQHVELLIQAWQIGGLLFTNGQYRRQSYLTERYQELSKTPLLIGNDFLHALSYYYEGEEIPDLNRPELQKRFGDLGKAVMGLNRRLSTHFQFDQERNQRKFEIHPQQVEAFRKGVRQALGIVARESLPEPKAAASLSGSLLQQKLPQPQEYIGIKTLNFCDLTEDRIYEEKLVKAFKENYDVFLFGSNIQEAIRIICRAVKTGRISEAEIDRMVMKLLILKVQYM